VLAEQELRLLDAGEYDDETDAPSAGAPSPKDRRDVFEVLTKGRPIEADGVRVALDEAIGDDGKLEPPLVLLTGELELPFDELETLKATAAALAPFAAGDPKLKEQLDAVEELLKTPYLSGSAPMAEGMTTKLKEAFALGKRPLPRGTSRRAPSGCCWSSGATSGGRCSGGGGCGRCCGAGGCRCTCRRSSRTSCRCSGGSR